jgi:hypothetical protein
MFISHLMIAATGPNISSLATRIDRFTSAITVGSMKNPDCLSFRSLPPIDTKKNRAPFTVMTLIRRLDMTLLTSHNSRSVLFSIDNEIDDTFILIFIDNRSKMCRIFQTIANNLFSSFFREFRHELIIYTLEKNMFMFDDECCSTVIPTS